MRVPGTAIALLVLSGFATAVATAAGQATDPATTTGPTTVAATLPTSDPTTMPTTTAAVGHPPFAAEGLTMTAGGTRVWNQGSLSVAELRGPVRIDLGTAVLKADDAVVWLRPARGDGNRPVDVVLLGHVEMTVGTIVYSYDRYWVPAVVTGPIRLVGPRTTGPDERSATYRAAAALIREQRPTTTTGPATEPVSTTGPATGPAEATDLVPLPPAVPAATGLPVAVRVLQVDRTDLRRERTADGDLVLVGTGGVAVSYVDAKQNLMEFSASSMVLFSNLKQARDATAGGGGKGDVAEHIVAGYFEGDVRVLMTPAGASRNELRMRAARVYYEFATDRAVLNEVMFHTVDARQGVPIFVRATAMRQLSQGEFKADGVELSTSAFATPTYGLSAAHAYVRSEDSGDPRVGERVAYSVSDVTLNAFGLPLFYVPGAGGTMTARGSVFRGVGAEDSNQFGIGVRTAWGLFESLGQPPPEHVDASYHLDYFSYRGPAGGINATYYGETVSELSRQPYTFAGDLHAYFVDDRGTDVLGAARFNEPAPQPFRGRVSYEHQHDFADDLSVQVRLGWDSDSNFLPQWFQGEYQNGLPIDESIYVKHERGPELATFLAEWQPNRVVTTADAEQENREVSHLPELGYRRVGDSVGGDRLSSFTEASASGEKFVRSSLSLAQQGFFPGVEPGRPAYAYTGDPGTTTYRGDVRQEVDYPLHLGVLNVVPYVMGRYTAYSQGVVAPPRQTTLRSLPGRVVVSSDQNRLVGGAGVRLTTDLWRVDDAVQSELFDLHRVRHVLSPEVTLFASGQTVDQDRLFIYDPAVDALNDVQAMQVALRQRWQTKRGGPGRWRSVDFFTLDLYANLFANQPANRFRDPTDFRSVFLQSEPEYSLPRNTANAEAQWRISDTTAILSSVVQNLDHNKLATANIGLAVTRGDRLSYFLGTRYIADLDSNVATIQANYQLDRKYTLSGSESIDLDQNRNVYYQAQLTRQFDNFSATIEAHYDQSSNNEGFSFTVSPTGLARGLGSGQVEQIQQQ